MGVRIFNSNFLKMYKYCARLFKFFLIVLLICTAIPLTAQSIKTKVRADSMLRSLKAIKSHEHSLDALNSLFEFYKNSNDSFSYTVLGIMKSVALKNNDNNMWAWYYYQRSFFESTLPGNLFLQTIDSSYAKAKAIGNNELIVRILSVKTMYLWRNKRYSVALETSIEALNLSETQQFKNFLPYRYLTTSGIYGSLGDTARQYVMALKACEAANLLNDMEAKAYSNGALANILAEKKLYDTAIELLHSTMKWFDILGLRNNVA